MLAASAATTEARIAFDFYCLLSLLLLLAAEHVNEYPKVIVTFAIRRRRRRRPRTPHETNGTRCISVVRFLSAKRNCNLMWLPVFLSATMRGSRISSGVA